ncbi:MAG: F0F1 ATP synthase subunit B [Thermosynechococcaceae cyanobacterium MS004]|nr:F0F1 ATP synthase subunit B [Thermosynechococcaceae cyanobacterium MS004]
MGMMFYWLAVESSVAELSESAEAHGFGINTDIFEANLINLAIVISVVVYFGKGFLGKILSERRAAIEADIKESEARKQAAIEAQKAEEQKLAQAEAEAERILAQAQASASSVTEQILAQAVAEIQRLEESASQDTSSSQERAIAELRQRVVELSLKKVEQELQSQLANNEDAQRQLIDRSIALLGGPS